MLEELIQELNNLKDIKYSQELNRFFKTWKWQYWYWDEFIWIRMDQIRKLSKKYFFLDFKDLQVLLQSKIHEYRITSLMCLIFQYEKTKDNEKKQKIFQFYIDNTKNINNWDLVDISAYKIIWNYLFDKEKSILYKFAYSENLWERRISIISTYYFIKNNSFDDTIKLCEILLNDKQDLIHKATGWMLREVWKRSLYVLEKFLEAHYKVMPRTMLRYSIEKLENSKRNYYLKKNI